MSSSDRCPHCGGTLHPHYGHPKKLCDAIARSRQTWSHISDVTQHVVDQAVATHKLRDREVRRRAVADYIRNIRNGRA